MMDSNPKSVATSKSLRQAQETAYAELVEA